MEVSTSFKCISKYLKIGMPSFKKTFNKQCKILIDGRNARVERKVFPYWLLLVAPICSGKMKNHNFRPFFKLKINITFKPKYTIFTVNICNRSILNIKKEMEKIKSIPCSVFRAHFKY